MSDVERIANGLTKAGAIFDSPELGEAPALLRSQAQEIERLRKWIDQNADHHRSCYVYEGGVCSCGFDSARIRAVPEAKP